MTSPYRPIGPLNWLLDKFHSVPNWSIIGTSSVEERSLAAISELHRSSRLRNAEFLRVEPSALRKPNRFRDSTIRKLESRQKKETKIAGNAIRHHSIDVLCREEELITACRKCLGTSGKNLIIDISSMPKRFFFPLIALAIRSCAHENILVAYSSPLKYGELLAEDPLPWNAFPMFGATDLKAKDLKLVIGVGYQSLRLHEIVSGVRFRPEHVELLLPFPSTHPGFIKNWEFVRQIRTQLEQLRENSIKRVPTMNTSIAFDKIVGITNNGKTPAVLAPYGPKPVSLAMCLYGISCQDGGVPIEIGYTQPQIYSDKYSMGTAFDSDGNAVINAYCIRLNGNNLYQI